MGYINKQQDKINFKDSITQAADLANRITDKYESQRKDDFNFDTHSNYVVYDAISDFIHQELDI
jgi:hypothetical protein